MVNPVQGFISNGRLFAEQDISSEGIRVLSSECESLEERIERVFSILWGEAFSVAFAGNVVTIDRQSAEEFFGRNKFGGAIDESLPMREKILQLVKILHRHQSEVPKGMLRQTEAPEKGGLVIEKQQFHSLIESLASNNFKISWLKEQLELQEGRYLRVDRELFFKKMVEENRSQLPFLEASGMPEHRALMLMIKDAIKYAEGQNSA